MTTDARMPKPVAGDLRLLKVYVSADKWAAVTLTAGRAGMSVSSYLKALIDRDELDESGRPVWASEPASQLPLSGLNSAA